MAGAPLLPAHGLPLNATEPEVELDRVADDLGREAVAGVGRTWRWRHAGPVAACPPAGNLTRPNLTVPSDLQGLAR
jgi:hypothetical protein